MAAHDSHNAVSDLPARLARLWLPDGLARVACHSVDQLLLLGVMRSPWPQGAELWSPARRQQFSAARILAEQLLDDCGCTATCIGRTESGMPVWPAGFSGSIAHDQSTALVAVAPARRDVWLAVDVEPDVALPEDAAAMVLTAVERESVARDVATPGAQRLRYARLVFCAKECVHKAINPATGAWLEFDEVEITASQGWDAPQGRWQARPLSCGARTAFGSNAMQGVWHREAGRIYALLRWKNSAISHAGWPATAG